MTKALRDIIVGAAMVAAGYVIGAAAGRTYHHTDFAAWEAEFHA